MKCINCRTEESGNDCVEVMHQGVEIGVVCEKCMQGIEGLRLFIKKLKNGTFELKEMQVIPNPR